MYLFALITFWRSSRSVTASSYAALVVAPTYGSGELD